ncbi:unnamed protein product [Prorocentrum cordatum]|uniref:Uncharacterized protein n=1 Tax=Prorocentrum cordatum TaxID=2364126 RepID=A0ABN9VEQ2_9DINO|nr:unnamed protein product [Polarella glacialis]
MDRRVRPAQAARHWPQGPAHLRTENPDALQAQRQARLGDGRQVPAVARGSAGDFGFFVANPETIAEQRANASAVCVGAAELWLGLRGEEQTFIRESVIHAAGAEKRIERLREKFRETRGQEVKVALELETAKWLAEHSDEKQQAGSAYASAGGKSRSTLINISAAEGWLDPSRGARPSPLRQALPSERSEPRGGHLAARRHLRAGG